VMGKNGKNISDTSVDRNTHCFDTNNGNPIVSTTYCK
jgi:hypothetical protein